MRYNVAQPWQAGNGFATSLNLYISSAAGQSLPAPWRLTIKQGSYVRLEGPWNWQASLDGGDIKGVASESWLSLSDRLDRAANLGAIVSGPVGTMAAMAPKEAWVNGVRCELDSH